MNKKTVMLLISVSAATFGVLLIYQVIRMIDVISNPVNFSIAPIFYVVLLIFALFIHAFLYVHFMDMQQKRHEVTDIEEWWKKWDQV